LTPKLAAGLNLPPAPSKDKPHLGNPSMRTIPVLRSLALCALFLSALACSHSSMATAVSVREAQLRSNDVQLPLTKEDQDHLLKFLIAGGNRDSLEDGDAVDLNASQKYAPLLTLLSDAQNLDPDDLQSPSFKAWFPDMPIRQVIDARSSRPPVIDPPFAVSDGTYWWVFSREGGAKFSKLVVFQAFHKPAEGLPR
jgi:hypothetical protein